MLQEPMNAEHVYSEQYINWVIDFLPYDLPPDIVPGLRLFFYNYDSYWLRDAIETRLWNLGETMLSKISSRIRRTEAVWTFIFRLPSNNS